jgi:hypothetical protein
MGYLAAYAACGIGCLRALVPKGCAAHGAILVPGAQSVSLFPLSKPSSRPAQRTVSSSVAQWRPPHFAVVVLATRHIDVNFAL